MYTYPQQQTKAAANGNAEDDIDVAVEAEEPAAPPSWRALASCTTYVNSSVSMLETEEEDDGLDCWLVTWCVLAYVRAGVGEG